MTDNDFKKKLIFPTIYNIFALLTRRSTTFSIPARPSLPDAKSPDGGIGRRAGLKHQWSNPCRFDPGSGYQKMQVLDFQTLAFFFFLFAPRLHHKNFVDCRSLAGYQVHFYRKTALGTLIFRGIKSSFAMFLRLVYCYLKSSE